MSDILLQFVTLILCCGACYGLGWQRGNLGLPMGRGIKPKKAPEISPEEMEALAQQRHERQIEDQRSAVEAKVAEKYSDLPKPLQDATIREIMAKGKDLFPRKA